MPRQTNSHRSHHKSPVATKTHTITNTKLAVAVMAALLAGGLAYASAGRQQQNQCTMTRMEFVDGESCRRNKHKAVEYVCSDGESGRIQRRTCQSSRTLQRSAERQCARRICAVEESETTNPRTETTENTNTTQTSETTDTTAPAQVTQTVISTEAIPVAEVPTPQADLSIGLLRWNEDQTMLLIRVENIGNLASESLPGTDGALVVEWKGEGENEIETRGLSLSHIEPGAYFEIEIPVPQNFRPNQLRVELDGQNKITESNETNNSRLESVILPLPVI